MWLSTILRHLYSGIWEAFGFRILVWMDLTIYPKQFEHATE